MTSPGSDDHARSNPELVDRGMPEEMRATARGDWAICCSGGGIRSAAYCLGALQGLDLGGLLRKARWILGVSGGGYIATSRALVAHHLAAEKEPPAYAPGTAEERNLRCDTRYMAPNGSTMLVGILSLFLGAICTFVIVLAPVYAITHAWGWLLRWQGVAVPSGLHGITVTVTNLAWWLPSVIAAGIVLILFLYWWWTLQPGGGSPGGLLMWWKPDDHDRGADRAWLVSLAATLTAGLALAMLAAPLLISWLTRSTGSLGTVAHFVGFGARPSWSWPTVAGLIAAVTAIAKFSQAGLAKWTATTSAAKAGNAPAQGLLTQLAGRLRQLLLPWLASAAIVLAGAVFALLWMSDGARAGFSARQLLPVAVALAVMLLARVTVNVNRLSMHDFYRWRLADAFAITREAAEEKDLATRRRMFADAAATRLSALQGDEPGLVICGTANINAVREVPAGQGGFCITFDPDNVTLHGQGQDARARTPDYEALVGDRRSTLFDVSAISGAAVSPLMGSATRRAYRLLFTATNVRLGVWLPHPNVVRDARAWIDSKETTADSWWERHPLLLLAWYLTPHLFWARDAAKNADREAMLWAHVLRLRAAGRRSGALWYRTMQPTLGLLWAEAAGRLSYRATWMYVTDGGHYDNLGLVAALRRGARHIVVLDASGDRPDTWSTLGSAIELARADAGVEIDLDPTMMIQGGIQLAPGQVTRPWAYGRFRRLPGYSGPQADRLAQLSQEGDIWICKLGWWAGAPWDVLAYARNHPTFPCDSTLQQLYDANEFGAYQELGAATVLDAAGRFGPNLMPSSPLPLPPPAMTAAADGTARPAAIESREPVPAQLRRTT